MTKKNNETTMSISVGGQMIANDVPLSALTGGFENTGHTEVHPVKFYLTDDDKLRYGQQYARNLRVTIPEIRLRSKEAVAPLEERLEALRGDRDYYIGELAPTPDEETGYRNEAPDPEHAKEMARILEEIRGTEAQIDMLKTEAKVGIAKLELENELIALRLNLGYEMRDATCVWCVDWAGGRKRLVRIGTDEVVLTKNLSPEERQFSMFDFEITDEMRAGGEE